MKQFKIPLSKEISCVVSKNALAKRMIVKVDARGKVRATVPWWISKRRAVSFVNENKEWILERFEELRGQSAESLLHLGGREDYEQFKEQARRFVLERLSYFNEFYNFAFERVAIRDQRTRWGSCSNKNNLNFNYRIVHLPKEHADYLIVHELCHLKHLNHSRDFWNLVAETIPDYRRISKELRRM